MDSQTRSIDNADQVGINDIACWFFQLAILSSFKRQVIGTWTNTSKNPSVVVGAVTSPLTTNAPNDNRRLTVANPIPDEPPVLILQVSCDFIRVVRHDHKQSALGQDTVPVTITTLFFKLLNSSSLILNSAMMKDRFSK